MKWLDRIRLLALFVVLCLPGFLVDLVGGREISLWGLYVLPVAGAGWIFGRRIGVLAAVIAASLIVVGAFIGGQPFDSWWHFTLAMASRLTSLLAVGWFAASAGYAAQLKSVLDSDLAER